MKVAMAAATDPGRPAVRPPTQRLPAHTARLSRPPPGAHRARWLAAMVLAAAGCGGGGGPQAADRCADVTCTAAGPCRLPGACDPATGTCSSQSESVTEEPII